MTISAVSEARHPVLFSFLPALNPFIPFSRMNAEIPCFPLLLSLTAKTTATSQTEPCVANVLLPFRTHPAPSRTAVERVPDASLPAVGSVRLQAPIFAPFASGTRERRFCSSVPATKMWLEQSEL